MLVNYELKVGNFKLSGEAWAEKPNRFKDDPGFFEFKTIYIERQAQVGVEFALLALHEWHVGMLAELGMNWEDLEQQAYEAWQEGGYSED